MSKKKEERDIVDVLEECHKIVCFLRDFFTGSYGHEMEIGDISDDAREGIVWIMIIVERNIADVQNFLMKEARNEDSRQRPKT